jgi:phosphatidylglycerol---prolipoprotein diacylglyceryl transferase
MAYILFEIKIKTAIMNILSVTWNVSPEMFSIGGFSVKWYGFLFAMGFFLAYLVLFHVFNKEKVKGKVLDLLTVYVFFATLIGARLGHVFFYDWDYYKNHVGEIFLVWEGGLASHGAGIAIVLVLIFFVWKYKVPMLWLFDRLAIVIPISAAFVRFGNLMNSEIYGHPTTMPWGFIYSRGVEILPDGTKLINIPCHPTQLYEGLSYLILSLIIYLMWRKKDTKPRDGLMVGIFLTGMFTMRFLIEFFKIPQEKFNNTTFLDMGQWLSIPFILLGIFFIIIAYTKVPGWLRWAQQKIPLDEKRG